jgi:hypothetical protein
MARELDVKHANGGGSGSGSGGCNVVDTLQQHCNKLQQTAM